ncbi:MAG: DUF5110 domain-containing protein [Phycisphaerales bacterium]|jgi:alpha-glucosidase|nr:DUF5110 domain-containing protein [Phycisphaerales bacterium]
MIINSSMKTIKRTLQLVLVTLIASAAAVSAAEKTAETKPKPKPPETFQAPGSIVKVQKRARTREYTFITDTGFHFKVTLCRDDVFRIQIAADGKFADPKNNPEKAQIIIDHISRAGDVKITDDEKTIELSTDKILLRVDKKTCRFELFDSKKKLICKELKALQIGEKRTIQTLSTGVDEYYYGGGQQNGYFSHKGRKIEIRADGNWNEGGHPNPAPFYMSNKGYGVLRHTFAPGAYDFTSNESIALEHQEQRFDAYYFVGASFNRLVDLYTQFTGRPNFVCIWALELGEADAYMTRDKKTKELKLDKEGKVIEHTPHVINRLAEQYRKHDMPGGWILPNDGYGCGYVELPRVVQELKALGFYTGLWTQGELVKTKWEVGTAGTRVQKLDVAWTGRAYQHSLDCNKQAWTSLVTNSETRGMVWTVQGWAGTQRYGVCWTGDQSGSWNLIRYHIPTLIGSGLSGQAYATTDVDGIFGGSPETYTRDLQWKCFTPVLYCMNGWAGKMNKSPWAYEEPYRSINRRYLKLKMRLTPYMYKYAREAHDTGAPITRGMIWEYPNDKKTWDRSTQHQYMLGESILVAPVYTSMNVNKGWRKEDIYLPKGQWIDYWDGRRIQGPATIDAYPITLDKLPLIIKAGAIIPMYPEMLYNNQKPKDPLTFDIYPYGESSFELYEDDGITRKYQDGESAKQLISCVAPEGTAGDIDITVGKSVGGFDGKLKSRVYQFAVHSQLKPKFVKAGGKKLLELTEPEAYKNIVSGWYFDKEDRRGIVHIRLARIVTNREIKLHLEIDRNQEIPASPAYPVPKITPELDKSEFIVTTNSQQGSTITNAFDGTPETHWHSNYSKKDNGHAKDHPYTVDIDLRGLYAINGFGYMGRHDMGNGMIGKYEIYVSRRKDDFGKPVHTGSFERTKDLQKVSFPAVWGEYVRLKILSSIVGKTFASAAEFDVYRDLKAKPLPDKIVYLSDLKPASAKGKYQNDKSAGGKPIKVNGQGYKKGIGVMSGSELVYELDGTWDKLTGHVGMDDEVGDGGSVMFRVYADGKLIFESPNQTGKSIKQLMDLNIKGVKKLRLVLLDGGDGAKDDHGDWVDAKLILKGSK